MRNFISIKNLKQIGSGHCAKVYIVDDKTLIKVLNKEIPYEKIKEEYNNFKNAYESGIYTSNVYEIVDTEEGIGFTFDYLQGKTIVEKIIEKPYKFIYFLKLYGKTIREMHDVEVRKGDFKSAKEFYLSNKDKLNIDETTNKILNLVEWIPDKNNFIHGDCNKNNFLFTENKGFVIDLADALCGNPIFDLLTMYFMLFDELDIKFLLKDNYKNKKDVNDVIKYLIDVPDLMRGKLFRNIIWMIILSSYLNTNIFSKKYKKANQIIQTYSKIGLFTLIKRFGGFFDKSLLRDKDKEFKEIINNAYCMGKDKLWEDFDFI